MENIQNISSVIKHLSDTPKYSRIKIGREYDKIRSLFGKKHQPLIKRIAIKNGTFYIISAHPLAVQEFKNDSNIKLIKSILKIYLSTNKNSILGEKIPKKQNGEFDFSCFKVVVIVDMKQKIVAFDEYKPKFYAERSRAKFTNFISNGRIYNIFEEIRGLINAKNSA